MENQESQGDSKNSRKKSRTSVAKEPRSAAFNYTEDDVARLEQLLIDNAKNVKLSKFVILEKLLPVLVKNVKNGYTDRDLAVLLKKDGGFTDITVMDIREALRQAFDRGMLAEADIFEFKLDKIFKRRLRGVTIPEKKQSSENSDTE